MAKSAGESKAGRQIGLGLLFLVIAGLLVVSAINFLPPNTLAGATSEPSLISDREPGGGRLGYTIPNSPGGTANSSRNQSSDPGRNTVIKTFNHEAQKAEIVASLNRRANEPGKRVLKDKLEMPEWDKIFVPGGDFRDDVNEKGMIGSNGLPDFMDLYDGLAAAFEQENISNGVATDMSALLIGRDLKDEVLYNGAVRAEHDLGNAYLLASISSIDGHLRLYAGVERLVSDAGTFIEFEFNQNRVGLSSGSPWPLVGERKNGDLLARLVFSDRVLQSLELDQWDQGAFRFVATSSGLSGNSCAQTTGFMYCVGPPPMQHPEKGFEVWDENYQTLEPTYADDFAEVGIDVDLLIGSQVDISSVLFRTPEDIVLGSFKVFERLAQSEAAHTFKSELIH
ncbi:hypothetical protein ACFL00_02215 [Pseudomonadota bacterium]